MEYKTIRKPAREEFIEKRSRFIGHVRPVKTEEEAVAFIQEIRESYRDASHNVYAYVLREHNLMRHSDDGEPSGTAGMPVLEVLRQEGLTDAAVVVTRYFGGTLLGTGGLVRAYTKSAKLAAESGGLLVLRRCLLYRLICDYSLLGKVQNELAALSCRLLDITYLENVELRFAILSGREGELAARLSEASGGGLQPSLVGEDYLELEPDGN